MFKRKRTYGPSSQALVLATARPYAKTPPFKRRRAFVPGRDRVGGYYGRFSSGSRGGGELKFFDVDIDDASIASGGTIVKPSANAIAQGVTESERIGRKCTIRSILWHYQLTLDNVNDSATAVRGDSVRVIVYQDKQCNGATALTTDILESNDFQSFRNLSNVGRFKILMDKVHSMNYPAAAADSATTTCQPGVVREYSFYKKVNIPLEFDSTTGAITELRSNNIGVLLLADAGSKSSFVSKWRIRFSDN